MNFEIIDNVFQVAVFFAAGLEIWYIGSIRETACILYWHWYIAAL